MKKSGQNYQQKTVSLQVLLPNVQAGSIREIKEMLHIEQNELNPYRKRLIRKGIADGSMRGYLTFSLPFFTDFVLDNI